MIDSEPEVLGTIAPPRVVSPSAGDLLPVVYEAVRKVAGELMRHERHWHTLQPTAVVHEAYLRLIKGGSIQWTSRGLFMAAAAHAIREVLVDHARARRRKKRGGGCVRVPLAAVESATRSTDVDVVALNDALEMLARVDPQQALVVEMRYFGNMSIPEVAEALGVSPRTVNKMWLYARAWLHRELASQD